MQARLVGILSLPAAPGPRGVLIVTGGPQYRVGSHRQFVLLARALAAQGVPVLRFDLRGMGDS
ncbi:hydrolase 1, exosortase A system-associated, partial [Janthinobacterium violaceinigrum]